MLGCQADGNRIELSCKTVPPQHLDNNELVENYNSLAQTKLPSQLEGDELRLKQVLINLIKNAIKFTRRGYVRVLVGYDAMECLLKV